MDIVKACLAGDSKKVCLMPRLSAAELMYVSGLVRALCDKGRDKGLEVMVVARKDHVNVVKALFGDLPGVRFTFVTGWVETWKVPLDGGGAQQTPLARLEGMGYTLLPLPSYRDVCPYAIVGMPATLAATGFKVQRDMVTERRLLDLVKEVTGGKPYAVVHDEPHRRIRSHLIPDTLQTVRTDDPRFDGFRNSPFHSPIHWVQAIDHAVQLHAIDSCFLMMAELLALRPRKFCHAYASDTAQTATGSPYRPAVYTDAITVWG